MDVTKLSYVNAVDLLYVFFFFQAEDGIRDLVRSRGLGDVYKRQLYVITGELLHSSVAVAKPRIAVVVSPEQLIIVSLGIIAVSYTHLTLPTSDLV